MVSLLYNTTFDALTTHEHFKTQTLLHPLRRLVVSRWVSQYDRVRIVGPGELLSDDRLELRTGERVGPVAAVEHGRGEPPGTIAAVRLCLTALAIVPVPRGLEFW